MGRVAAALGVELSAVAAAAEAVSRETPPEASSPTPWPGPVGVRLSRDARAADRRAGPDSSSPAKLPQRGAPFFAEAGVPAS